jgi:hypothetical protein
MSNQGNDEDEHDTPAIGEMPEFKAMVSAEEVEELSHLPEASRQLVMPVLRAISISDQRAAHHFKFTTIHNKSIRKIERSKRTWISNAGSVALWFITTILGAIVLSIAAKYIN